MRKIIYALVYLIALVAGVCLLVFNHQAMEETRPVLRYVIMGAGVAFVIQAYASLSLLCVRAAIRTESL